MRFSVQREILGNSKTPRVERAGMAATSRSGSDNSWTPSIEHKPPLPGARIFSIGRSRSATSKRWTYRCGQAVSLQIAIAPRSVVESSIRGGPPIWTTKIKVQRVQMTAHPHRGAQSGGHWAFACGLIKVSPSWTSVGQIPSEQQRRSVRARWRFQVPYTAAVSHSRRARSAIPRSRVPTMSELDMVSR